MMHLYRRVRSLVLLRPVAVAIILVGVVASAWGFIDWYGPTFALYPAWQWPFVPDCPLFALLFAISLALILLERDRPAYNALVALGLIKYGIWTILVWVLYWGNGGLLSAEGILMTLTHTGMVLEGLFLLSFLKMDWPTVVVCALWFGLSDWMDYGPFETYPGFPRRVPFGVVQWHTVGVTALMTAVYVYMALRRRQAPQVQPA
jgi:uncharacterized membrane protein YpjA